MAKLPWQHKALVFLALLFLVVGFALSRIPAEYFVELGSIIAVTMISLPACIGLYKIYGQRGLAAFMALGLLAITIETIGIHTGFPYSPFEYTMGFGYRLFGTTPWTVFIAWSPLVVGSFLLTEKWFKQSWSRALAYLGILVSTDVVLDPGAVARGLWEYSNGGPWFNVPVNNFFGWILSGFIAYMLLKIILAKPKDSPSSLWLGALSLFISLFLWTGVSIGYALWLPAVLGIILSLIILIGMFGIIKKRSRS